MPTIKLQDTATNIGQNARLDQYWATNGFQKFYSQFRKGVAIPVRYRTVDNLNKIVDTYRLNAIGFGNWVTQEDRYNYLSAMFMAFYDIDKVLQFKKNIGLNKTISMSFGARGKGGALAHFEPGTFIINITRYSKDAGMSKEDRFALTGGAGSVAHEYGHALDYYFGRFRDQSRHSASLSGGRSTKMSMQQNGGPFRTAMDGVMDAIIWKVPGTQPSAYYGRLKKDFNTDYMLSRCEIFARAFEKYIQYKLQIQGVKNTFLTEPKYHGGAYLTDSEIVPVAKKMDVLVGLMNKVI